MKHQWFMSGALAGIFIAGCGAQPAQPEQPTTTPVVIVVTATSAPAEASPTITLAPLPQPQPQSQPQPTLVLAPTIPILPVTGSVLASPKGVPLNCRGGPSLRWPVGHVLNPGENVEVVGRNTDSTWWYVKDPSAPIGFCWISADYATVTGNTSNLSILVVTGVPMINGTPVGIVTRVEIKLEPNEIDIPGCIGPGPSITIRAKIHVDGPLDIRFHFEGDDIPNLHEHHYGFSRADIDDVTDSFTPPLNAGKHQVFMVVNNMDLSGTGDVATYTIKC